jgi:hypothetical protein
MFDAIVGLVCWKCGASLAGLSLPLRRQDECRACGAELHACRLCEFYDTAVAKSCREPVAEEVKDKTRANFCDYFKPRAHAFTAAGDAAGRARSELESLFGGAAGPGADASASIDENRSRLEELFGAGSPPSPRK